LAFAALGLAFAIVCAVRILLRLYRQLGGEPAYAAGIARKIADGDRTAEVKLRIGEPPVCWLKRNANIAYARNRYPRRPLLQGRELRH